MSGALMLHSETIEKEVTECALGERAIPVGTLDCALGCLLRRFSTPEESLGSTIRRILEEATIDLGAGGFLIGEGQMARRRLLVPTWPRE